MDEIKNSLVSVIIPTKNRPDTLANAVNSVLSQTWKNLEILVIDDNSDLKTKTYLSRLKNTKNIKVFSNVKPFGAATARNLGIKHSIGNFVAFLDDDDLWAKNKIELQLLELKKNPNAVAASCWFYEIYQYKTRLIKPDSKKENDITLFKKNSLGGSSVILARKDALAEIKNFDEKLKSCQDWDLWIKLSSLGEIVVCKKTLMTYSAKKNPKISNNLEAVYQGNRRIYFKYKDKIPLKIKKYFLFKIFILKTFGSNKKFIKIILKNHKKYNMFQKILILFKILKSKVSY